MVRALLLSAALLVGACSPERDAGELFGPSEAGLLVVDAQLIVGEPLPDLFLRRTAAPGERYDAAAQAVLDARVVVSGPTGEIGYSADPDSAGRYLPASDDVVQPQTEYRLDVRVGDEVVTARTTTPGILRLREVVLLDEANLQELRRLVLFGEAPDVFAEDANGVVYLDGLLEKRIDPVAGAAGYQLSLFSLDEDSDFVIDADFLEEDDYEDFERQGASPALDAENGRVRLPWFAVAFAGRHVWHTYALDRNWYDLARTDPDVGGGGFGELAGDSFQRPLFHVEGGIGLFGSAAVDSVGFVVRPVP
jgi:hypothetical protein